MLVSAPLAGAKANTGASLHDTMMTAVYTTVNPYPVTPVLNCIYTPNYGDSIEYPQPSSLACLAGQQAQKGLDIIAKIKANPEHTYYPLVSRISTIDLKIIELKK